MTLPSDGSQNKFRNDRFFLSLILVVTFLFGLLIQSFISKPTSDQIFSITLAFCGVGLCWFVLLSNAKFLYRKVIR